MAEDYRERLQNLLRKLFQFDSADPDFGIYRIMNRKRDHIERFIQKDLIDAVDAEFVKYSETKQVNLNEEVAKLKAEIFEKLGEDAFESLYAEKYHRLFHPQRPERIPYAGTGFLHQERGVPSG